MPNGGVAEIPPQTDLVSPARQPPKPGSPPSANDGTIELFPLCLPDELHASQAGRYHRDSGNATTAATYRDLYDWRPFCLTDWIPQHLERFAAKLPGSFALHLEGALRCTTMFPLLEVYGNSTLALSDDTHPVGTQIRNLPKRIVGERGQIRLCIECMLRAIDHHGKPYILRAHHAPGVRVCGEHGLRLETGCPYCGCPFEQGDDLILVPWFPCPACRRLICDRSFWQPNLEVTETERAYALFARDMLLHPSQPISPQRLSSIYREKLATLGYMRRSLIDHRKLLGAVEEHFGTAILADVDAAYRKKGRQDWLRVGGASALRDIPLTRHLLFSQFLFGTAESFWEFAKQIPDTEEKAEAAASPSNSAVERQNVQPEALGNLEPEDPPQLPKKTKPTKRPTRDQIASIILEHPSWKLSDLWLHHKGLMNQLLAEPGNAIDWLNSQLAVVAATVVPDTPLATDVSECKDASWARRFATTAIDLYASTARPIKITRNRLLKKAGWGHRPSPSYETMPLARQQVEEFAESEWHYYARRVLHTKLTVPNPTNAPSRIPDASGVEYHRALALVDYFADVPPTLPLKPGTIIGLLIKRGIQRDWNGPAPTRKFPAQGRRHVKRGAM